MDSSTTFPDAGADAATTTLAPAAAADRCATCGAHLAADQRYCLECGERRGDPRLPFTSNGPAATQPVAAAPVVPAAQPPRGSRGANATLVAGIGTLLLAMGVGVLIGRSGHDDATPSAKAPPVQVVTVAGAGGAVAAAPDASSSTPSTSTPADTGDGASPADKSKSGKSSSSDGGSSSKSKSSGKVSGSGGSVADSVPQKVVKVGSKGSGKGYKNGKFTGDFFGQ